MLSKSLWLLMDIVACFFLFVCLFLFCLLLLFCVFFHCRFFPLSFFLFFFLQLPAWPLEGHPLLPPPICISLQCCMCFINQVILCSVCFHCLAGFSAQILLGDSSVFLSPPPLFVPPLPACGSICKSNLRDRLILLEAAVGWFDLVLTPSLPQSHLKKTEIKV